MIARIRLPRLLLTALAAALLASCAGGGSGGPDPAGPDPAPVTPPTDQVSLSATSVAFGAAVDERVVRLVNRGGQPIAWRVETTAGWLSASPAGGTLATGEASVELHVDRGPLATGSHGAEARFVLDEIILVVAVTVDEAGEGVARLDPTALSYGPDDDAASLRVTNEGTAPLVWSLSGPDWIALSPASGTTGAGATSTVSVSPDRTGRSDGTHAATLTFASNGGTASVAVTVAVASSPRLRVSPSAFDFGTSGTSATMTIANDGGRPLVWSAAADAGWVTPSASGGSVSAHSTATVTLRASRSGLSAGGHQTTLRVTSNGGSVALGVALSVPSSSPPPPPSGSVALAGRVLDQFSGGGVAGLTVQYEGGSAVTDSDGRFSVAGTSSTSLEPLDISGSGIHRRQTFARGSHTSWEVLPSSFNMTAFNDLAREYEPRTIRWTANPRIYIDTEFACTSDPVPQAWVDEVANAVQGFIDDWSDGVIGAGQVTVGTAPPSDYCDQSAPSGWIVIQFDEDPSHYPSEYTVGLARTYYSGARISSAAIWLRFGKLGSAASTWRAVFGHELGHTFGMGHMSGATASIMTPSISTSNLTSFDRQAGEVVYRRSPGNSSPDSDGASTFMGGLVPAGRPTGSTHWVCGDPAYGTPETTPPIP